MNPAVPDHHHGGHGAAEPGKAPGKGGDKSDSSKSKLISEEHDLGGPALLSVVRCPDYDPDRLQDAITKALEAFGGLEKLVQPGNRVLLKPNLLSARRPESAATTHPQLVEILARQCRQRGAKVFIGDSPPLAQGRIEDFWASTGMAHAAERSGATLVAFEKEPRREIEIAGPNGPVRVHITEQVFQADVTFNLPKLKTHNLTGITGAVKNHYGLLPGLQKAQFHRLFPRPEEFSRLIVSICEASPMTINLLDGIMGMDGQGPAGGRPVPTGVLLASRHPTAIDLGICAVTGADPSLIPTISWFRRLHHPPFDLSQLTVIGEELSQCRFSGFRLPTPSFTTWIPESLVQLGRRLLWLRPALKNGLCIKCRACMKICPASAIEMHDAGIRFRRRACISCFCCMEVCPRDAIEMQGSSVVSLLMAARWLKHRLRDLFRR